MTQMFEHAASGDRIGAGSMGGTVMVWPGSAAASAFQTSPESVSNSTTTRGRPSGHSPPHEGRAGLPAPKTGCEPVLRG